MDSSDKIGQWILLTLIEHATPTSAMHPPSAAEIVAPRLKSIPIAEAVRRKCMTSRSGECDMNSVTYLSVAGMTPAAPLVLRSSGRSLGSSFVVLKDWRTGLQKRHDSRCSHDSSPRRIDFINSNGHTAEILDAWKDGCGAEWNGRERVVMPAYCRGGDRGNLGGGVKTLLKTFVQPWSTTTDFELAREERLGGCYP